VFRSLAPSHCPFRHEALQLLEPVLDASRLR
jgi:hypothetical protein